MGCKQHQKHIALYAGGELSSRASRALAAHMETCDACRAYADAMIASRNALRQCADASDSVFAAAALRGMVAAKIAAQTDRRTRPLHHRPLVWAWVSIGVVLVAAIVSRWPGDRTNPPRNAPAADETAAVSIVNPAQPAKPEEPRPRLAQIQLQTDDPNVVILLVADNRGD